MFEVGRGFDMPTTRQKVGRLVWPMNVPAGTSWAVMVVFGTGNGMPVRLAQFDAAADTQPSAVVASNVDVKLSLRFRLVTSEPVESLINLLTVSYIF